MPCGQVWSTEPTKFQVGDKVKIIDVDPAFAAYLTDNNLWAEEEMARHLGKITKVVSEVSSYNPIIKDAYGVEDNVFIWPAKLLELSLENPPAPEINKSTKIYVKYMSEQDFTNKINANGPLAGLQKKIYDKTKKIMGDIVKVHSVSVKVLRKYDTGFEVESSKLKFLNEIFIVFPWCIIQKPKKAPSAFLLFSMDFREIAKKNVGSSKIREVSMKLKEMWESISPIVKANYVVLAKRMKAKADLKLKEFREAITADMANKPVPAPIITGGGSFAWASGHTDDNMNGLWIINVDEPNKKTEYTRTIKTGGNIRKMKWTLDWTTSDIELTKNILGSTKWIKGIDTLKTYPENKEFYKMYSDKFFPTCVKDGSREAIMFAYAVSDTDIAPKKLKDFRWQYDANYSHGAPRWEDMNADQWEEMSKAFLEYRRGGPSTFTKTVSSTHGNHSSPPTYEYTFEETNLTNSGSPPFSGMVQRNTNSDFKRPIRVIDGAVAISYVPKFMKTLIQSQQAAMAASQQRIAAAARQAAAAARQALVQEREQQRRRTEIALVEWKQKFSSWPITLQTQNLRVFKMGKWLDLPYHEVEELTGRIPTPYRFGYESNLLKELFEWRELPELEFMHYKHQGSGQDRTFVNYFRLSGVRFHAFMDAVQSLKRSVQNVKCSIVFHGTSFQNIEMIIPTGFQNRSAGNGSKCGVGSYNALYPYADYTMYNNPTSDLEYIQWDRGFGAMIVSIAVVVPSEYTKGQFSVLKSGQGTQGTRNSNAVCGGTFLESKVASDGTIPGDHREVVFWYDKLRFLCPLGIAIFKK